jgi:hypothetical protein
MQRDSFDLRAPAGSWTVFAVVCASGLSVSGCGDPAPTVDTLSPPPEWAAKFEKEHPEAFKVEVKSTKKGKKLYQEVGPRERMGIFIREWAKAKAQGQGQ